MIRKIVFHPLLWLLILTLTIAYAGGSRSISTVKYVYFTTSTAGDTAQVSKITPTLAIMGFEYKDSISYWNPADSTDTTAHSQIAWTSPMQAMLLTIGGVTATPGIFDSTVLGTVQCSLQFNTDTLGIDFDASTCADDSLNTLYDSLVATINAKAALTDTVDAQDSGSYIKLVSLIGEGVLLKAWTVSFLSSAGAPSDSADTAGHVDSVTIAMICDSMVATSNASDTFPDYMTAIDSSTFYIIQSDDAGLLFYYTFYNHADTHGTLAASQANVTSSSDQTDTLFNDKIWLADDQFRALGIHGDIVIDTSITDSANAVFGLGLADSASLWVRSYRDSGGVRTYRDLDSVHGSLSDGLPVTLHISRIPAWANDTVFFDGLVISWYISDTLSQIVVTRQYPIYIDLKLTEM